MGLFQYVSGGKFFSTVSIYVNLSVYCEYRCDEVLSFLTSMFLHEYVFFFVAARDNQFVVLSCLVPHTRRKQH